MAGKKKLFYLLIVFCSLFIINSCNPFVDSVLQSKTVLFDTNGGNKIKSQILHKGEKVVKPVNPVKKGNVFLGWYQDNYSFSYSWDFSVEPKGDMTLYAKWKDGIPFEPDKGNVKEIIIIRQPDRMEYYHDDFFEMNGVLIMLKYEDDTIFEEISHYDFDRHGVSSNVMDGEKLSFFGEYNNTQVIFTVGGNSAYTEGLLKINPRPIESAAVMVLNPIYGMPQDNFANGTGIVNYIVSDVKWSPAEEFFNSGVEYNVAVTIIPKNSAYFFREFSHVEDQSFTINYYPAIVYNNEDGVTMEYKFPETSDKVVTGITIVSQPKLDYTHDDKLEFEQLLVRLTFSDDTSELVTYENMASYGITARFSNNAEISPSLVLSRSNHNNLLIMVSSLGNLPVVAYTDPLNIERAESPERVTTDFFEVLVQEEGYNNGNVFIMPVSMEPNSGIQTVEFELTNSVTTPEGTWSNNIKYTGLSTGVPYYIHARAAQNNDYYAGVSQVSQAIVFFNVNYDANNAAGGDPPVRTSYLEGSVIIVPSEGNLLKSGLIFGGWNENADGTGNNYMPGQRLLINSNLTLYARWIENRIISFTIQDIAENSDLVKNTNITISRSGMSIGTTATIIITGVDNIQWSFNSRALSDEPLFVLDAAEFKYFPSGAYNLIASGTFENKLFSTEIKFTLVDD